MFKAVPLKLLEPCQGARLIERRAWACLERCQKKLGLSEIPLPVPVEAWIEHPLGIRLGFEDLSRLGPDVLGGAFVEEQEILIDQRVTAHEGRCRFTCAHELGHLVLHRRISQVFRETQLDATFSEDVYERQANRFAAAFLMPLALLEREIVAVLRASGLEAARCLYELMQRSAESEWLWRYRILPAITERFAVSLTAAIFRCADVQPWVTGAKPLLPRSLANRLRCPAGADDPVTDVQIVDGVPRRQLRLDSSSSPSSE